MKKKILFFNNLIQGGGVEKLMLDLVWAWHEKYDITVMSYWYDPEFYSLYPSDVKYIQESVKKEYKQNVIVHAFSTMNRVLFEKTLVSRTNKLQFDVMLCIKEGLTMKGALRYDIPEKYLWVHTDYNAYHYTAEFFTEEEERLAMQQFKKVICVAKDIEKGLIDVLGDPGNLTVYYNPIKEDAIKEKAEEPVVDLEPISGTRFVSVGRLNYQKGYLLLLEVIHWLEKEGYQFEVDIVGGKEPWGDEHDRLNQTIERLGIKSVKMLGARQNPYKYMKKADWFLSSSLFEGYSLVSQEVALLDIPLILTDVSGARELLGDNEFGIVAEPSVYGLYTAMKDVLDHPEKQEYYKKQIMERKKIITYQERIDLLEELVLK